MSFKTKAVLSLMIGLLLIFSFSATSVQAEELPACLAEHAFPHCDDGQAWNGYWWEDKVWIPGRPTVESWFIPTPDRASGYAVYYEAWQIEATAADRKLSLKGYVDGVALMSPADIGLPVWIRRIGFTQWEGPFLVVDSSNRNHVYLNVVYREEVTEVGFKTARRWGMTKKGDGKVWRVLVEISKIDPACLTGKEKVVYYPKWWLDSLELTQGRHLRTPVYRPPGTWLLDGEWATFTSPNSTCQAGGPTVSDANRMFLK